MSRRHPAWKVLGIEPTSDARAIRSAYTARLKGIDPEADPQAFILLRDAFEAAKRIAESGDAILPPATEEGLGTPVSSADYNPDPAPPPADTANTDKNAHALFHLLYSATPEQPRPTAGQSDEMLALWHAMLADLRMQRIDYFADVEGWFVRLIAETLPFSDPLVIPAVETFGWISSDGSIYQSPIIAELIYRYHVLVFARSIAQPGNRHYEAWQELTTPATAESERGKVSVKKVHRLLHLVRSAYPDLEASFDSNRLDLWDRRRNPPPLPPIEAAPPKRLLDHLRDFNLLGIVGVILAFGLFYAFLHMPTLPPRTGGMRDTMPRTAPGLPLTTPEADLDAILHARFGDAIDMAKISAANPPLAATLQDEWRHYERTHQTQDSLDYAVTALVENWYRDSVRSGSAALLADYHRLMLDMGRWVRANDPKSCETFFDSDRRWREGMGEDLRARETGVIGRALLETDGKAYRYPSAPVSGELIDATARRAHVPRRVIETWLERQPIGNAQCDVTIAFIEAMLARPRRDVVPLMRVL